MLLGVFLFFYFVCLSIFSFIGHPVYYCILLVVNSLFCCFICYSVFGFSWYALLFCLVYVGGIYILFIFVSVHSPNSSVIPYWNLGLLGTVAFVFVGFLFGWVLMLSPVGAESSNMLCSSMEGWFYVCMCLTLLFGFVILSSVLSIKHNYYR
uniref:NADH dehydrogenase subunit 6 n=1 Tax=Bothridium pithonis TaxID=1648426 RepID=A0A8F7CDS5_9CEST|nr:NADH dehydrogenase subunit 6 [Bothridium pithonis]